MIDHGFLFSIFTKTRSDILWTQLLHSFCNKLAQPLTGIIHLFSLQLQDGLEKGMKSAIKKYPNDKEGSIIKAVNDVQSKAFHCCGANNYKDWVNMTVQNWPKNSVPESCCKNKKNCHHDNITGHESDIYQTVGFLILFLFF